MVLLLTININLVHKYTPVRSLCSSNSGSLDVPKSAKTWGERAIAQASPALWNEPSYSHQKLHFSRLI